MSSNLQWKVITIAVVGVLFTALGVYPLVAARYGIHSPGWLMEKQLKLGLDLKNRSPFRHTYVAELANDWIGYLPDLDGHKLGGYQTWTGFHSYAEPGTGERIVEEVVKMLKELAK